MFPCVYEMKWKERKCGKDPDVTHKQGDKVGYDP